MVLGGALGPGLGGRDAAAFCVAGVALGDIHFRFAWQAWHNLTSTFHVAGVALMVLGGALGPGFGACDARGAAALCVAGVALGDIHLRFTWQAWHKRSFCVAGASLMVLGGALGPGLGGRDAAAFCVAGVALGDIHFRFAWQAWHKLTSTVVLRGRRGTYGTGWRPWARFRRA